MEFLEKLYEIENFGIYLFVVIGVLIVMFLVVLFFGKKDAEKNSVEKETKENEEVKEAFTDLEKEEKVEVAPVEEVPVIPAPVEANVTMEEPKRVVMNQVLNDEETREEPKEEVVQEKEFDFDALAEAISKELESIDNTSHEEVEVKPVIEEKEESLFTFVPEAKVEEEIPVKVEEEKREEVVKPKVVRPEVFSSVYVRREKETPKVEEKKEEPTPEVSQMDLPKKIELPKRAQ